MDTVWDTQSHLQLQALVRQPASSLQAPRLLESLCLAGSGQTITQYDGLVTWAQTKSRAEVCEESTVPIVVRL